MSISSEVSEIRNDLDHAYGEIQRAILFLTDEVTIGLYSEEELHERLTDSIDIVKWKLKKARAAL